jgi:hypothetical protein
VEYDIDALDRDNLCRFCVQLAHTEERQFEADEMVWAIGHGMSS